MDERIYIGSNGHVSAIDPHTGEEIWRTPLQEGILKATRSADVAILVRDGIIYAGSQGHLFALSAAGEILWHNPLRGLSYNDISIACERHSIQYLQKTVHHHSQSSSNT